MNQMLGSKVKKILRLLMWNIGIEMKRIKKFTLYAL